MRQARNAAASGDPTASPWAWRLVGRPPRAWSEVLVGAVGLRVMRPPGSPWVLVIAGSLDRLRDLSTDPASLAPTARALIVVAWWRSPRRGWSGTVGPLAGLRRHRVALPRWGRGVATVGVRLARPVPLREILSGAQDALRPVRPLPAPVSPEIACQDVFPAHLPPGGGVSVVAGPLRPADEIRAFDLVLHPSGAAPAGPEPPPYAVAYAATRHGHRVVGGVTRVLVDAQRVNPRGRRASSYRPDAPRVALDIRPAGEAGRRWAAASRRLDGPGLDGTALAALRRVGVVDCRQVGDGPDPVDTAALLIQLAMTGVLVHAPALPDRVARLVAPELRDLMATPVAPADALATEARSVRQRRLAMRAHATGFAAPAAGEALSAPRRPPSVSAILASRRPEMLESALAQMTAQTYPDLEIILCLHGVDPPHGVRAVLAESGRPFEIVPVAASANLGEVLAAGTRRARGSLVTKFDDDDSYGPEHVWDLVLARHYSGATLVGKGTEFVFLEGRGVTVRRPSGVAEADGEVVAGGTMLIAKGDLEAVGGWRPVPRSVDLGLIQRLRRAGAVIYRTHPLGYVYHRRGDGHTWNPGERYFLRGAYARWPGPPAGLVLDQCPASEHREPPVGAPTAR